MWSIALKLSILNRKSVYDSNSTCCSDLFRKAKTIQNSGVAWGFSGWDWTELCQKFKTISRLWFIQLSGVIPIFTQGTILALLSSFCNWADHQYFLVLRIHYIAYSTCFSNRSDFIINIKILFQGSINECNMGSQIFLEGNILILLTAEMWQG